MKKVNCALCGSTESKVILTTNYFSRAHKNNSHLLSIDFQLVSCKKCGLIYLNPMPNANELSKFYSQETYYDKRKVSKIYSKIFSYAKYRRITAYNKKGKILDVGCGNGGLLLLFKRKNWDTYGVETSEIGYQIAKEKLKTNVYHCDLEKHLFPDNHFDVIVLNHVLEHLPYPLEELKEIYRILKPEGTLYLSIPNIASLQFKYTKENWFHLDIPRHVYQYSDRTIKELLEKTGFRIVRLTYGIFDFPLDLFHSVSAKWLSNRPKLLRIVLYLPLLFMSTTIKLMPAWRGTMEVIARRHSAL